MSHQCRFTATLVFSPLNVVAFTAALDFFILIFGGVFLIIVYFYSLVYYPRLLLYVY